VKPRFVGLDVARGLAVLLMLQTHAYDAWVAPEVRASPAFALTRLLGTLPLPLFLLIAGLGVGARVTRAASAGTSTEALQRQLLRQAARVIGSGYALNALYALMDGHAGWSTLLRIDVLHCIGLCVGCLALCLGDDALAPSRPFALRCLALGLFALGACPILSQLARPLVDSPWRWLWAPWVEVPNLSPMPVVPLAFFACTGAALGARVSLPALAGQRAALAGALWCGGLIALGELGQAWLQGRGVIPARSHPIIWFNALSLLGRAGAVLALTLFLTRGRRRDAPMLSLLGRHALLLYGLHLPFCYGRLATPLKRASSFGTASLWLTALVGACWAVCWSLEARTRSVSRAVSLGA